MSKTNHDVIKDKVRFVNFYFILHECIGEFLGEFSPRNTILELFDLPIEWAFLKPYEFNSLELRELRNRQNTKWEQFFETPCILYYIFTILYCTVL